jgi:hypothetical protein
MGTPEIKDEIKKQPLFIPFSQRQINFEKDYNKFRRNVLPYLNYSLQDISFPTEEELKSITKNNVTKAKEAGIENTYIVFLYYLCQRFVESYVIIKDYNIFKTLNNIISDISLAEEERESLDNLKSKFEKEFPMDMKLIIFNLESNRYRDLKAVNFLGIRANLQFNKDLQPEVFNLIIDDKMLDNYDLCRGLADIIENCSTLLVVNYILYPRDIDGKLEKEFGLDGQTYQSLFSLIKAVTVNRKIKSFVLHSMKDYNINLAPEICRLIEHKLQSETLISFHFGNFNLTGSYEKKIEFLLSSTKSLLFLSLENKNYTKENVLYIKNYLLNKNRSIMALSVVTPIFNGMKKSVIEKMKQGSESENKDSKLELIYLSHKSLIDISWLDKNIL